MGAAGSELADRATPNFRDRRVPLDIPTSVKDLLRRLPASTLGWSNRDRRELHMTSEVATVGGQSGSATSSSVVGMIIGRTESMQPPRRRPALWANC